MRKIIFVLIAALALVFFISDVSGQMVFISQPNSLYNIGDVASVSVNVITSTDLSNFFSIDLLCNGMDTQIYKEYLNLAAGGQKEIDASIPLTSDFVGGTLGSCKIKAILGNNYILTPSFQVSNHITVEVSSTGREFKPGQQILIQGNAVKDDNTTANGVADLTLQFGNNSVYNSTASVTNGFFYFNFSLPNDSPAGSYLAKMTVNEFDSFGAKTNTGLTSVGINIDQIPTNLELMFENQSELSGETMKVAGILHDQTGERINSTVNFTVVDGSGNVMDQEAIKTGEFLEVPISYDSPPSTWTVYASSDGLSTQSYLDVLPNPKISAELFNNTLLVENKGNVPYDKPLDVLIGNNESRTFNLSLGVGQSKKFILSAPNGNYSVQVSSAGSSLFTGNAFLTGNAVGFQQASGNVISLVSYPWVWGFVIFILAVVLFFIFRGIRRRRKKFTGKANLNRAVPVQKGNNYNESATGRKDDLVRTANKADMSLSMQGERQGSSVVCLGIKNFEEAKSVRGGITDIIEKLKLIAESSKSMLYENGNNLFFIFAPVKTKTFKNELDAVNTAEQVRGFLEEHNRMFKQKIQFGLAVHYGDIIAQHAGAGLRFMSLGDFSSTAKRLASFSGGEILLSKEIRDRLLSDVKSEKRSKGDFEFYVLREVKDRTKNQKFINDFVNRMNREKKD